MNQPNTERPKMPTSQIWYGDTVYWLCILAALACMIGPMLALMNVDNNLGNPHFLYQAIFDGMSAEEVWNKVAGGFPGGHFWASNLGKGDGFTQFGLCLGGFVAAPALVLSAIAFIKEKQPLWVCLALWNVALIVISASGVVNMGH